MRKNGTTHSGRAFSDRRWLFPFLASLLVSVTLFLAAIFVLFCREYGGDSLSPEITSFSNLDDTIEDSETENYVSLEIEAPRIAYLITGTKGDSQRMRRTLLAIYHPRNQYILHLDLEAPPRERIDLAMYVRTDPVYSEVQNVRVIAKANLVTYKGPTMIACTLHAIAILLKDRLKWDWFINLSASDYPLMTQDDLLHVFSSLPRDLNFVEHTQITGWKLSQRAKPILIDPGLYLSKKFDVVFTTEHRELPTTFKLFTGALFNLPIMLFLCFCLSIWPGYELGAGSAWVMLSRNFLEYCIWGWENLPRTILMYYANFVSSPEGYFQTVICNSDEFQNTTISHDFHYIAWDNPPKQHPRTLSIKDFDNMILSGAPFARKFHKVDGVLDKIDRELLGRSEGQFTPGAWCIGGADGGAEDPCSLRGNDSYFQPGPGAKRFGDLIEKVTSKDFRNGSCSSLRYDQTKREWIGN
ncbi:hypothetical protein AXF42_Ash011489 [Apostasia shenzhenica]|uniref:Xylosyltransferase 1 n=1 Tax=Apostasia shenzhenica TaxID=1088818 RepID=A0A2I0BAR3_9ASPA|nr:hypothetical protein AXF42_Ash011489 [Apostasia shenzhenica]